MFVSMLAAGLFLFADGAPAAQPAPAAPPLLRRVCVRMKADETERMPRLSCSMEPMTPVATQPVTFQRVMSVGCVEAVATGTTAPDAPPAGADAADGSVGAANGNVTSSSSPAATSTYRVTGALPGSDATIFRRPTLTSTDSLSGVFPAD